MGDALKVLEEFCCNIYPFFVITSLNFGKIRIENIKMFFSNQIVYSRRTGYIHLKATYIKGWIPFIGTLQNCFHVSEYRKHGKSSGRSMLK